MSKKSVTTFAQALVHGRKHLGLTKTALARRLEISPATVTRWELGRFMPDRADRWRVIAALAGVPSELEDVLYATLNVPRPPEAPPPAPVVTQPARRVIDDTTARFVLDSAVLAMAERLPSAPVAQLRGVLTSVLERLASAELEVPRALVLARAMARTLDESAAPPA